MAQKKDRETKEAPAYSLFARMTAQLASPAIRTALTVKSEYDRVGAAFKSDIVHFDGAYAGQPIVLLALYQKGILRPDIRNLLEVCRSQGFYIIGINTLTLKDPETLTGSFDCYIERHNYGRDFGSFRSGFQHVFRGGLDAECPRLLMINDSVFYSRERLPAFLSEMMESPVEVLGSTENYEIHHHLGSFCIALSNTVLTHARFRKYWTEYRQSDVRPVVIKRGEMGLSRALRRSASSSDQMQALYDSARFSAYVEASSDKKLDEIISLTRQGDATPARRFLLKTQMAKIEKDYLFQPFELNDLRVSEATLDDMRRDSSFLGTYSDMKQAIQDRLIGSTGADLKWVRDAIIARLIENFRQHSQIHQNAAILLDMGLPIIKLDLVYRGMANLADVRRICGMLDEDEAHQLTALLLSRPFGGEVYFGWRRAAFLNGLI